MVEGGVCGEGFETETMGQHPVTAQRLSVIIQRGNSSVEVTRL